MSRLFGVTGTLVHSSASVGPSPQGQLLEAAGPLLGWYSEQQYNVCEAGHYCLKGTKDYANKIALKTEDLRKGVVTVYADADWAKDRESRKSTSCGLVMIGEFLVVGFSRTQGPIALSSGESEYYAMCAAVCEGIFVKNFLKEQV